jgi:23S rRNA pseudouridine1911/1915/1917 synthase
VNEVDESVGTREVLVKADGNGRRLDVYLSARFPIFSRAQVQRMITQGQVAIVGRRLKRASILYTGEVLEITAPGLAPVGPPPPMPPVLYEDERLLVVDKPSGMLAHPTGIIFAYALVGIVRQARPEHEVDLAHRLDRETSGVSVLTKDMAANAQLKAAFKAKTITKIYQAIVHGSPEWQTTTVDAPIGAALSSEIRIRRGVNPEGSAASTTFKVLKRMGPHSLIEARPETGRTHQIRVHLEHLGHPILGDKIYGQPDHTFLHHLDHGADAVVRQATGFPRHALHAAQLTVPHPDGGHRTLEAPLGEDLQAIVDGAPPAWPSASE